MTAAGAWAAYQQDRYRWYVAVVQPGGWHIMPYVERWMDARTAAAEAYRRNTEPQEPV